MPYAIYLRKSRKDRDLDTQSGEDTLSRHRTQLLTLADSMALPIGHIYQEVVSGETIAARPEMRRLLDAVEQNAWEGVLVMEVERLARGDTIDQGVVFQAFRYSGTKIITPSKVYDPENEFDEEYFEFGLFMSRREYKTINRRIQRGRAASVREGKWAANRAPYGYHRRKLTGEKGWTLEPDPEHAQTVRWIFQQFTNNQPQLEGWTGRSGAAQIAGQLNELGLPSPSGAEWSGGTIRDLLRNPAYAGWVRWNTRPTVKKVISGTVRSTHPRAAPESVMLFPGRHPALVSQAEFDAAQDILDRFRRKPQHPSSQIRNPLSGLLVCSRCGRTMVRRPLAGHSDPMLVCPTAGCPTKGAYLSLVEHALLASLEHMFGKFVPHCIVPEKHSDREKKELLQSNIRRLTERTDQLAAQKERACELAEQSVYTPEQFLERTRTIDQQASRLQRQLEQLYGQLAALLHPDMCTDRPAVLPGSITEYYMALSQPCEKNELLKSLLDTVFYHKTEGGRWKEGDLELTLFLRPPSTTLTDNPTVGILPHQYQ